jgi:ABC-type multidrug transport system ATPase subunit
MLAIHAHQISKKYQKQRIFKDFSATFQQGKKYAILGTNGSGKSTLLKVLSKYSTPDEGEVKYISGKKIVMNAFLYMHISYVAPYISLFKEFTVSEMLEWLNQSKRLSHSVKDILANINLQSARNKYIKHLSSGMYQRLKLATGIFTTSKALFLDEPCTNLDSESIQLYHEWINAYTAEKIVIIASNQPYEYQMCDITFDIQHYKA